MFSRAINFLYLLNQIRFNSWSSIMYESIMRIPIGHDQNKPILFLMKLVHFFFFCNGRLLLSSISQYYELCFSSPFFFYNGRFLFSLVSQYHELRFFPLFFLNFIQSFRRDAWIKCVWLDFTDFCRLALILGT